MLSLNTLCSFLLSKTYCIVNLRNKSNNVQIVLKRFKKKDMSFVKRNIQQSVNHIKLHVHIILNTNIKNCYSIKLFSNHIFLHLEIYKEG